MAASMRHRLTTSMYVAMIEPPVRLPLSLHDQLPKIVCQGIHCAGCLLHPLTGALVLLPDELHAGHGAQVYLATF